MGALAAAPMRGRPHPVGLLLFGDRAKAGGAGICAAGLATRRVTYRGAALLCSSHHCVVAQAVSRPRTAPERKPQMSPAMPKPRPWPPIIQPPLTPGPPPTEPCIQPPQPPGPFLLCAASRSSPGSTSPFGIDQTPRFFFGPKRATRMDQEYLEASPAPTIEQHTRAQLCHAESTSGSAFNRMMPITAKLRT